MIFLNFIFNCDSLSFIPHSFTPSSNIWISYIHFQNNLRPAVNYNNLTYFNILGVQWSTDGITEHKNMLKKNTNRSFTKGILWIQLFPVAFNISTNVFNKRTYPTSLSCPGAMTSRPTGQNLNEIPAQSRQLPCTSLDSRRTCYEQFHALYIKNFPV